MVCVPNASVSWAIAAGAAFANSSAACLASASDTLRSSLTSLRRRTKSSTPAPSARIGAGLTICQSPLAFLPNSAVVPPDASATRDSLSESNGSNRRSRRSFIALSTDPLLKLDRVNNRASPSRRANAPPAAGTSSPTSNLTALPSFLVTLTATFGVVSPKPDHSVFFASTSRSAVKALKVSASEFAAS